MRLLYLHQGCGADTDPCSSPYRSAMAGDIGMAAGMVLGTLATYLFVHDAKASRARA